MTNQDARTIYEQAKTNVTEVARLTIEDPPTYIPALRDAVLDMEDAWMQYVNANEEATNG